METNRRQPLGDGTDRTRLVDGSKVGNYTVNFLAAGGMSVVYKGLYSGRQFVLKEVHTQNTQEVPSLLSEKSLLERLNHPGIVKFRGLLTQENHYYLVVDYIPGQALTQWVDSGRLAPVSEVVDWGVQLAEIFDYLHNCEPPIIFRDLKPENIMLHQGKIKLIDFGIARLHKGKKEQDTTLFGSVQTAAPEQYGSSETDARSDVYSLGMTLYLLLTGGKAEKVGVFQMAPLESQRPEVPEELSRVIHKAIEFKPEDRFSTAREFRDALGQTMNSGEHSSEFVERTVKLEQMDFSEEPPKSKKVILAALILAVFSFGLGSQSDKFFSRTASEEAQNASATTLESAESNHPNSQVAIPDHAPEDHLNQTAAGLKALNIPGNIFVPGQLEDNFVVFLGEDVGLLQVDDWSGQNAKERAKTLTDRLNSLYHAFCPICSQSKLEPQDIRIGRYSESGDVVVFYAHQHQDGSVAAGPHLLATVTDQQAKLLERPAPTIAGFWRDLFRDTLQLSRGQTSEFTPLGRELKEPLLKARELVKSSSETGTIALGQILRELTGSDAFRLRSLFLEIPDQEPSIDDFQKLKGYEPLTVYP